MNNALRSARSLPLKPLSPYLKRHIADSLSDQCHLLYKREMQRLYIVDSLYNTDEESSLLLNNLLFKFDLSKCGPLLKRQAILSTNGLTLEENFLIFFKQRLKIVAKLANIMVINIKNQSPYRLNN